MTSLISFIVLLLVLIFVHELGHFLAAKLLGVKVERFSLGFPPKAWSKTIGETEYQLAWLPLGGYVKMYGEDPYDEGQVDPSLRHRSFSHKPAWAKIIIVLAGPVFNLLFAAVLLSLLYFAAGKDHLPPVIGPLAQESIAFQAGLRQNDEVLAVNGQSIKYYDELDQAITESQGLPLTLTVRRQQQELAINATPHLKTLKNLYQEDVAAYSLDLTFKMDPVVGRVLADRPAQKAGLQAGDRILSIDGHATADWEDVLFSIQGPVQARQKDKDISLAPLKMEVERQGKKITLEMKPELSPSQTVDGRTVYITLVGMEVKIPSITESLGLLPSLGQGFKTTVIMIREIFVSIVKLFQGTVSIKTLGGPLQIAQITGQQAEAGWLPLLKLAAFISINLGILNLLPIPVLDGGQLVFFTIEAITRRPVSLKVRLAAQWVGIFLLGLLMITVFYNDIIRFLVQLNIL